MKIYVYTNKGWENEEEVLTPNTRKVKKTSTSQLVEVTDELTEKFKKEMPFVVNRRGHYFIQSVN